MKADKSIKKAHPPVKGCNPRRVIKQHRSNDIEYFLSTLKQMNVDESIKKLVRRLRAATPGGR